MVIFEIQKRWVKALWATNILRDIQVSRVVAKPLETDSQEEILRAVSSIIDKKQISKERPLVLSIPRDHVTLRNLKFPSTDEKELDNIVGLHLTQHVPYSRDEIIYSYTILEKKASGFTHVLLGIVHRETLRKQFSIFEKLNLYPDNILMGTFGLMKFLNMAKIAGSGRKETAAVIDINSDFSELLIFREEKILFSKNISLGATLLNAPDKISKFTAEVKQAIAVFQTEEIRDKLLKLYVTGVMIGEMAEIKSIIGGDLQIPVEIVDPRKAAKSLKEVKDLNTILAKTSICSMLGCGMSPMSKVFNFVLPEAKLKMDVKNAAKNFIITGSIGILLVVLILFSFIGKVYIRQNYLDRLTRETYKLKNSSRASMRYLDKIRAVKNFTRQRDSFLYYYYKVSNILPKNITIDRMIFNKKKEFSFVGRGTAMGEIWKFVSILKDADVFGKIELRYSRKKRRGETEFNEFEIICHLGE